MTTLREPIGLLNPQPTGARPQRPDARLLTEAAMALQRLHSLSSPPRWTVLLREERRRSTLFELVADHEFGSTHAYYKAEALPAQSVNPGRRTKVWLRFRDSMRVEARIADPLAAALAAEQISFDRALAVDVEQLSGVRLAVPGRPLGRASRYALPGRRDRGLGLYRDIGRAVSLTEQVTRSLSPPFDADSLERRLARELAQALEGLPPKLHAPVSELVDRLMSEIDASAAAVWGHGDLSSSNILIDGTGIGFIDFSWRPYLGGESVAYLVGRLAVEPKTPAGWRRAVVSALLEGYGATSIDSWSLAYLLRLLRWANKPTPVLREWSHAQLTALVREDNA